MKNEKLGRYSSIKLRVVRLFERKFIGIGSLEKQIKQLIQKENLFLFKTQLVKKTFAGDECLENFLQISLLSSKIVIAVSKIPFSEKYLSRCFRMSINLFYSIFE